MTQYSAGEAVGLYKIDATQAYAEIDKIKAAWAKLQAAMAKPAAVASANTAASAAPVRAAQQQAAAQAQAAIATAKVTAAQNQAATSAQRLAQAQAQSATAAQRQQTASAQTAIALQRQASAAAQAQSAQLRLAQQQARAAAQAQRAQGGGGLGTNNGLPVLPRTIAGLSGQAASVAGGLGIGVSVAALAQGAQAAAAYATSLGRTEATLRAVAGNQARYNEVVALAAANQKLFGGNLQENEQALQQFLFISNRSGASLGELNRVASLLAVINPAEGFQGAGVALSEFFSGDITSIVERFNLPRKALNELKGEGVSTGEKIAGITKLLAEQGITAETLAASLTADAQAYNRLGAAGEQVYTRLGQAVNAVAAPLASLAATGLERVFATLDRTNELQQLSAGIVGASRDYEQYAAMVKAQNEEINRTSWWQHGGAQLATLTEAQYAYAQALIATGVAGEDARKRATSEGQGAAGERTQTGIYSIGQIAESSDPALEGMQQRLIALAVAGGDVANGAFAIANGFSLQTLTAEQMQASVAALEEQLRRKTEADSAATGEIERASATMDLAKLAADGQATALQGAAKAAYEVQSAGGGLTQQARAAAAALLASGAAGAQAAALLAGSTSQVDQMTAAQYRLASSAQASQAASRAALAAQRAGERADDPSVRATKWEADYQAQLIRSTGTTAEKLALARQELATTLQYSEARKAKLVEVAQLEQQLAAENERAGTKAAKAAETEAQRAAKAAETEAQRAAKAARSEAEARFREAEQAARQIERRTEDHLRRLRQMQEDYALDASRDAEDYQVERQRLLAEGNIREAQLLEEKYNRDRARAAQDAARARQRQTVDFGTDIARTQQDTARDTGRIDRRFDGAAIPVTTAAQVAAAATTQAGEQAAAILTATAGQRPAGGLPTVRVEFAPINLILDGRTIATATYPYIEKRMTEDLVIVTASSPVTTSVAGGGRP